MTKKQINLFEEYAKTKEQIALLMERAKELEPKVLKNLDEMRVDTYQENYGTFSVVRRKAWTYSDEYQSKEEQYNVILKEARREEQENNIAKAEETKGLSYRKYEEKK